MEGNSMLLLLVLFPMAGALVCCLIGRFHETARDIAAVVVTAAECIAMAVFFWKVAAEGAEYTYYLPDFCALGLRLKLDGFRVLYGTLAAFMWLAATVFSNEYMARHENKNRYYLFLLLTLGATLGVFFSADLFTTFLFFEIMSFTSYVWVAQEETREALRAAQTYLAVAVIGGLVMLMGVFLLYSGYRQPAQGVTFAVGVLLLFGFGAKAGMFPLHIWLPKAHPVAPAPASALLSGMLTKTGIYGVLVVTADLFWANEAWGRLVLVLGVITMLGGAVLAVFSVDLKRTLACSSMSQIGFILVGVGMQCFLAEENAAAARGTLLHMVNHSLIKLVLFTAAGVVFMNLHELDLNKIRGFGKGKPLFAVSFLLGAFGIAGLPFLNGYVSKTLLHESIVEYKGLPEAASEAAFFTAVEWLFLFAGGLTVAYMAKLCVALFVEKGSGQEKNGAVRKPYMNGSTAVALTLPALLLLVFGAAPSVTMDKLADLGQGLMTSSVLAHPVHYFTWENLSGAAISFAVGAAVYFGFIRTCLMRKNADGVKEYVDVWPVWMDLENFLYRPVLFSFVPFVCAFFCRVGDVLMDGITVTLSRTVLAPRKQQRTVRVGSRFTHALGSFMDGIVALLNRTVYKKKPIEKSFVSLLAVSQREVRRTARLVSRSVSFGLLMFCVGLVLTLSYLLF